MFARIAFRLGASLLWFAPGLALAQAAPTASLPALEPEGYKAAITAAVEEYEQRNFSEAREHFERAHALFSNARTLRGRGITEFELRNYGESVQLLEQALASPVRRLEGPLRQETEGLLLRARAYVGEVHLDLEPVAATVAIDGITMEVAPQRPLVLDVGDHVLEFRAEGRLAERRAIKVKGGQVQRLRVELHEIAADSLHEPAALPIVPAPATSAAPRSEQTPLRKRWWLWTVVGAVAAGAAVGTALALTADTTVRQEPVTTANTPDGVNLHPLGRR